MYEVGGIKPNLKSAISWAIVAEIIRRHGDRQSLQVLQTQPGGGQYDCLSFYRLRDCNTGVFARGNTIALGDLNRHSGNFRTWIGPWQESYPWLNEWLTASDPSTVVDRICELTNLSPVKQVPATSRQTFAIGLIAALVGVRSSQRNYLDATMGYEDSSGIAGCGFTKSLHEFTALFRGETQQAGMSQAAACWMLYNGDERQLLGAVRTDGFICSASDCQKPHDLFQTYRRKGSMEPVLFEALAILAT